MNMGRFYAFSKRVVKLKPGKKFYLLHRYFRRKLSSPLLSLVSIIFSCVAFILGLIMLFMPGPGLFFICLSLLPFVAISNRFAKLLDKVEIAFRKKFEKYKVNKKKRSK